MFRWGNSPYFGCMRQILFFSLVFASLAAAQIGNIATLENAIENTLQATSIPGAAVAVVKDNRLVYAKGFGLADRELKTPMTPDTLMRVGSISKPITAMAILKLIEQGKLSLDTPVVPLFGTTIVQNAVTDKRWNRITIRHLLNHSGGWDAEETFDALLPPPEVIEAFGLTLPLREAFTIDDLVSVISTLPLQFEPGSRYAYSNFGFGMLSRIVEIASGMPYEKFVRAQVLEPAGLYRMRLSGGRRANRHLGEASYYDSPGAELQPSVYPDTPSPIAAPDGGFYFEMIQGAGAWAASAVDLARFAVAADTTILQPSTRALWTAPPAFAASASGYYGLGVLVQNGAEGQRWLHDGAINGSYAYLVGSAPGGFRFAVIFNGWPGEEGFEAFSDFLIAFDDGIAKVSDWPAADQFANYFAEDASPRLASNGVAISSSGQPGIAVGGTFATLFGANLGGSAVTFDGLPARVVRSERDEVSVIVPAALSGRDSVRVEARRGTFAPASVRIAVQAELPGIFTASGNGQGPAAASNEDDSDNDEEHPAASGSTLTILATGLGDFTKTWADTALAPTGADLKSTPKVWIDGVEARVLGAQAIPGIAGRVVGIAVVVPQQISAGLREIRVETASGLRSRENVYVWIAGGNASQNASRPGVTPVSARLAEIVAKRPSQR
jgi:uncharacterized protein (TIGR03437 family)